MDAGKVARTGLKRHVLMARLKNGLVVPGLLDSRRQQQVRFEEPEHVGHHSGARPLDASEQRDTLRFGRARGVRRTAPRHNARSQGNCRRRFRLIVAACDRSNSHSRTAGAPVGRCRSSQSWGSWRPRRRPSPAAGRGACWRRRRCLRCSCGGRAWLGTDGESSGPESRSCGGSAAVGVGRCSFVFAVCHFFATAVPGVARHVSGFLVLRLRRAAAVTPPVMGKPSAASCDAVKRRGSWRR